MTPPIEGLAWVLLWMLLLGVALGVAASAFAWWRARSPVELVNDELAQRRALVRERQRRP